jgi:hypothetical protein
MSWKEKMAFRAAQALDKRGGSDAVKDDALKLKDIASGEGTIKEKLARAKDALKEPHGDMEAATTAPGPLTESGPDGPMFADATPEASSEADTETASADDAAFADPAPGEAPSEGPTFS